MSRRNKTYTHLHPGFFNEDGSLHTFARDAQSDQEIERDVLRFLQDGILPDGRKIKLTPVAATRALLRSSGQDHQVASEIARDGRQADALHADAVQFARQLLASIPTDQHALIAAPPPPAKNRKKEHVFDWRNPAQTGRHRGWADCADCAEMRRLGQSRGLSQNYAACVRAELTLVQLLKGEPPKWGLDGRKNEDPRGCQAAAALFPVLWKAHTTALETAEAQHLQRDTGPQPRRMADAELLVSFLQAATNVRCNGSHYTARALIKITAAIVADFKQKETTR